MPSGGHDPGRAIVNPQRSARQLHRPEPVGGAAAPGAGEVDEPRIVEAAGLRWIHIEDPRLAHREWLEQHYDFHPLDWEDVYSRNQRSKLDAYDYYLFIVMHFPFFEKSSGRLLTAEVDRPGCRQRAEPSQTPRATTVVRNA